MKTYPVYLNGKLTYTDSHFPITNPANGETFARMSSVDRPAVAQALQDAHAAFRQWRQLPGKARGDYLHQIAAELQRRKDEVARLVTLENGKPLMQSQGETAMAIDHLIWYAEEARRAYGRIAEPG